MEHFGSILICLVQVLPLLVVSGREGRRFLCNTFWERNSYSIKIRQWPTLRYPGD